MALTSVNTYAIPKKTIEVLIAKGEVKREVIGDSETGRVVLELNGVTYYFHQCKLKPQFYIREMLY